MKSKSLATLGCLFGCYSLCAIPATASSALTAPHSALADGGNKLAADDVQGAIRSLRDALRAEPANPTASRLLSLAYLHARQHDLAAEAAETALKLPSLTTQQRAVISLLLGRARYNAFLAEYEKCRSQAGDLPNMAQLLSQMATHKYPTSQGDVIITSGDVNAQDDFETIRTSLKDTVTRLQRLLDQADAAYKDALAADPHLSGIHDGIGMVRTAQGYLGEARREFLTELTLHGPNGSAYLHLGNLDATEKHSDDAIENLRRAVVVAPEMEAAYRDLIPLYAGNKDQEHRQWAMGMSALRRGDLKAAATAFAYPSPKSCDLLCGQAQLCLTQKRTEEARTLLTRALAMAGHDAWTTAMLGDVEEAAGHSERAIALYRQAVGLDTNCDTAWYGIGLVYDRQNDRQSARADYAQALQANPNNPLARLNLAADEADLGQAGKAVSDLREYEERFPTANNIYAVDLAIEQIGRT